MSFTDGKPRFATEADCVAPWSGGKNGKYFRCMLCGHRFVVGDQYRFVYSNDLPGAGGNPLVCKDCDSGNDFIRKEWKDRHDAFKAMRKDGKWWWFFKQLGAELEQEYVQR